jgi:hypothetical protein
VAKTSKKPARSVAGGRHAIKADAPAATISPVRGIVVRERHVSEYRSDPENARKHNPRNVGMIVDAVNEVGVGRSLVVTEDDIVRAGNGTMDACIEAGITRVVEIETDGSTIVAVKRSNLDEDQKRRLALYDNRAAELATWDREQIRRLADENPDSLKGMFTEEELSDLLAASPDDEEEGGIGTDGPLLDQAIQLRPAREYVVVMCADGEKGAEEFERLKLALDLAPVRRGGYKAGSPFDQTGTQRVIHAADLLKRVGA